MNSVKNAIVTMTLLAVSYGAYVVLNNPAPNSVDDATGEDVWSAPSVSAGPLTDGATTETAAATSTVATLPPDGAVAAPPDITEPVTTTSPVTEPATAAPAAAPAVAGTPADTAATTPAAEPNVAAPSAETNYYVAEADGNLPETETYPVTDAPALPLGSPRGATTSGAATSGDTTTPVATEGSPTTSSSAPAHTADNRADSSGFEATWQSAQADLQSGQLGNALLALSAWYGEPSLTQEQQDRTVGTLDQLAGSVIYSRDSFLEPAHSVQPGETLDDIARQYSVSAGFLARINGISAPYELVPGETLKTVRGPFRAEVDRESGVITLFLGSYYAGRFVAKCGDALPPGDAMYEVVAIEPGHPFFDTKTGRRIDRDDPQNPFGNHWIGFRGEQITAGHNVGIHVDNGTQSTSTCIAVSDVDADDLSAILTIGSRIMVRR